MPKLTERRLTWAFGLALLVLGGNALVSYHDLAEQGRNTTLVVRSRTVLDRLHELGSAVRDAESARRGFLIDANARDLADFHRAAAAVEDALRRVDVALRDRGGSAAATTRLADSTRDRLADLRGSVAQAQRSEPAAARADFVRDRDRHRLADFHGNLTDLEDAEVAHLAARMRARQSGLERAFVTFSVASTLGLITLGVVYVLVRRLLSVRRRAAHAWRDGEARIRLLFESVGEGIYGIDVHGRCTFCNPSALRILGFDRAERVIGRDMHALIHHTRADGSSFPAHECPIYATIHEGEGILGLEDIFFGADGGPIPVEYRAHAIRRDEAIVGAVVTFIDITARRRSEDALRRSEARLRLMVESVREYAIFSIDLRGRVSSWNPGAGRLFGLPESAILGQPHDVLFADEDRRLGAPAAELSEAAATGRSEAERRQVRGDGSRFVVSGLVTPVRDDSGALLGYTKIARDVTEARRAEAELRTAKEAAEAASRAKATFLANMGHELRTPLNAIIGYSEMLAEEAAERGVADLKPDLDRIRGSGHHLLRLINNLLDLSRIEAGGMDLRREPFDVADLIRGAVQGVESLAQKQGNSIQVEYAGDLGTLDADARKVSQGLHQLLSNAVKFTEAGTISVRATRARDAEGREWLRFAVSDDGIGMTRDEQARLFQPFVQADGSAARRFGGTGLGLTITHRFCQMMGGTIRVDSEPGRGSTFIMELPTGDPAAVGLPRD